MVPWRLRRFVENLLEWVLWQWMQNITFKETDKVQFHLCSYKKKDSAEEALQWIRFEYLKMLPANNAYRISLKACSQPHYLIEYVCICMDMAYIQHILVKPLRKIMVLYYREARKRTFQDLTFQDCQNLCINSLTFPYLSCLYFIMKIQFQNFLLLLLILLREREIRKMFKALKL